MVARQGGDEFLLLLSDLERGAGPIPGTEAALIVAESVAERVHEALQEPFNLNGTEFIASGSVGISLFPQDALDAATLLKNADAAMYQSKKQDPGGYVIYATSGEDPMKKLSHDHAPSPCRGAGELDPALPAGREPSRRLGGRGGGARSLAGPERRHRAAGGVHPARGGARPDRGDRRLGDRRDGGPATGLGRGRPRPHGRVQPVAEAAVVGAPGREGPGQAA